MRIFNLFPWRYVIRRIAHRQGFLDPLELLARLRRFSQPSEVQEPIELIRAGMVFHARGLVNTKVIQNNLDWIWPYWIVRQFSPDDSSFIPRAFSFSHVNLTHRNWTAIGVPGCMELPVVDPRGMVTPHHDDWSVDHWFVADSGESLFPSTLLEAEQSLKMEAGHAVETLCENSAGVLRLESEVVWESDQPVLRTRLEVEAKRKGRLVVSARPCNPEGIQFIDEVRFSEDRKMLDVGSVNRILFERAPDALYTSDYRHGDVLSRIRAGALSSEQKCEAGLASAAAAYPVGEGEKACYTYRIPITTTVKGNVFAAAPEPPPPGEWEPYMADWCSIQIPDTRYAMIYESSKRTLALLSQSEILPGPYTYRRFWFRDACLIGNALLGLGKTDLVKRSLESFPHHQHLDGYFHSQEGEWDSNGQVLWLADRYEQVAGTGEEGLPTPVIRKAARWIDRKRRKSLKEDGPHRGLLPAGFSAEHLGPNDYYYWDNFWGAAGLRAAEAMLLRRKLKDEAEAIGTMAKAYEERILETLAALSPERVGEAIPAAPGRRMDSGAIGSMVADYPLRLSWVPGKRILATADWLMEHSLHKGGFFQNMIHSGINAYLTLDLAQTYLNFGDKRYLGLIEAAAQTASPTGKWPEAVHPHTEGGCMGDGEHAWAAAEWCQALHSLFLLEEEDRLVLGKGIPEAWLEQDEPMSIGPTRTRWGPVSLTLEKNEGSWDAEVKAAWHGNAPHLELALPAGKKGACTSSCL